MGNISDPEGGANISHDESRLSERMTNLQRSLSETSEALESRIPVICLLVF